jgi:hypothetical protein
MPSGPMSARVRRVRPGIELVELQAQGTASKVNGFESSGSPAMRPGRGFQLARKEFGMRLWQMLSYQVRAQGKIIGDLEDFLIDVQTGRYPI